MKTAARIARSAALLIGLLSLAGCHALRVPANAPSSVIALRSFHGRYVTALKETDGWSLRQSDEAEPGDCAWFTRYDLADGKIALETCHGRFVTAPRRGTQREDWEVWQESGLGDCAQFVVERHGDGLAFKTCAGRYITAGDGGWPAPLQWSLVAETDRVQDWEIFTVLPRR
jgi:hypothetical protein